MRPVLLHIGDTQLHAYVLAQVLGYAVAAAIGVYLARQDGRDWRDIIDGIIVIVLSAVLGAKLFHTLFEAKGHVLSDGTIATGLWDLLREDPWHWARLFEPGFVFYGGVVVGTLMGLVFVLRRAPDDDPLAVGDYAAPGFILGGVVVGRLGCLLAGCCYGKPSDVAWAIHFPVSHETHGVAVHPVQLYDVAFGVLALVVMALLYKKKRFGGEVFIATLSAYATWRFFSEMFRGDGDRGVWLGGTLSTSQLVSLSVLPVLLLTWFALYRRSQRGYPLGAAPPDEGAAPAEE